MVISNSAKSLIMDSVFTVSLMGSYAAVAQESSTLSSIRNQLMQLARVTDKELMIRQKLADVPLNDEQLRIIDQQGYIEYKDDSEVVISSLGGDVNCYIETRFLLSDDVHYDAANDVLVGRFQPDKNASNIMCSNFTDIPEAIRCSVNADGKTARIAGEKLNHYYQRCVHQMNRLLSTSS